MDIDRKLAISILKYLDENDRFYFPFLVMCKEYSPEDDDYVEVEPNEWRVIKEDGNYQSFQLWENLRNLNEDTIKLLSKGFIEVITGKSLEKHVGVLAKNYKREWVRELHNEEGIEEYGLNEFIAGKADAFEDCLYLIRKYTYQDKN